MKTSRHRLLAAAAAATFVGALAPFAGANSTASHLVATGSSNCTWTACSSDARWLRTVLHRAGLGVLGSTGTALTTQTTTHGQRQLRYFWATPGTRLAASFKPAYRVGATSIYTDRTRIVWHVQKARIWIEPVPPRFVVRRIVAASHAVPRQ